MGAGRHPRSIAGDDSAADHDAGSIEKPTAAEAHAFLECSSSPSSSTAKPCRRITGVPALSWPPSLPLRHMETGEQECWDRA
ncbi:MAG: hypothetical protein K0S99_2799, partial [Thermomicrobiales bacterium]|nr:hypothetical protein [Thermomicrobiales bacterium]